MTSAPSALALLTHELRTPLNVVCGYAEAMAAQSFGPLPDDYLAAAGRLAAAARQAAALVADLEWLAALEAGTWRPAAEPLEPEACARAAIALLPEPAAAAVRLQACGPATVSVDPRALRHILLNLLDNAARHGEGTIDLRLEAREAGCLTVEVENRVGAPAPGSGLGLALVGALARAHGGAFDFSLADGRALARAVLEAAP